MRVFNVIQNFFNFENKVDHPIAKELKKIDEIIDSNPQIISMVGVDLMDGKEETGRYGMSADQALRAALIKQFHGHSYEELAFRIQDSITTQEFMRLNYGEKLSSSTLQENIIKISSKTWDFINQEVVQFAIDQKVEDVDSIRTDSTVVKTNIHKPTDSALLMDCLRVLVRVTKDLRQLLGRNDLTIRVKLKSAKKIAFKIINAKTEGERKVLYEELLIRARKAYANLLLTLEKLDDRELNPNSKAGKRIVELNNLKPLFEKVIFQATERIINGKKLPPEEKIVSIFEDHTDIIVKDRRETLFGHKVFVTSGKSNLILDYEIPRGNPSDKTKLLTTLNSIKEKFDIIPQGIAADAGFVSKENIDEAIEDGIKNITLGKEEGRRKYARKDTTPKELKKWRAGIEGIISYLKRCFGLSSCDWKGFKGFIRYVKSSIATYNLRILARHLMA